MSYRVINVLFLCTGNSARSIMAEAVLNQDGQGLFRAYSAGSHPRGEVNPFALKVLASQDYAAAGLRSKSWDEFGEPGAPEMDFVFTVCDRAAGEVCPVWPASPMRAHWGIDDPAAAMGTELEKEAAFRTAFRQLQTGIGVFLGLKAAVRDAMALKTQLREIGQLLGNVG